MSFLGYPRPDGSVGVRNHLLILPTVVCAATVAERIAYQVGGAIAIPHQHGCAQMDEDRELTTRTLTGIASNPNVGAVLLVSLGCESLPSGEMVEAISSTGKPVEEVIIQEVGGSLKAVEEGVQVAEGLAEDLSGMEREVFTVDRLIIGLECGGSDATSGLIANPALGYASDLLVKAGGTVILSETTEVIGAEHILAGRAITPRIREEFLEVVRRWEAEMEARGIGFRGGPIQPGNVAGGLTTVVEKSLGCIYKGGSTPLREVVAYAQKPRARGLVFMDTPGQDVESITGMIAGGAQVIIFTTGRGTPTGSAIAPVIKVTGNPRTYERMKDNIDLNAGEILSGKASIEEMGEKIYREVLEVASGKRTKAEILGHREFAISKLHPTT